MAGAIEPVGHGQAVSTGDAAGLVTADGDEPTDEEKQSLRKVADKAAVGCLPRLHHRALRAVHVLWSLRALSELHQRPSGGSLPGAIGLGQSGATGEHSLHYLGAHLWSVAGLTCPS